MVVIIYLFGYDSITISSVWELTSVYMRYSEGDGVNNSLYSLHSGDEVLRLSYLGLCRTMPYICWPL